MPTLFLSRKDIKGLLDMGETIQTVEQAFRDYNLGQARMPPKAYLTLEKGDFRAMPAAVPGAAGMKWVNVHLGNPSLGLPTVMGIVIYNDPETGYPLAVMDATEMTAYRTGATAAIASRYLARTESRTLGLIGAGRQAQSQLMAHALLFRLEEVRVFDPSQTVLGRFIQEFSRYPVRAASAEEASASDIVCTVTPARSPVVRAEWVKPGTHINAIGADAKGKEELEPAILKRATVVVDDIRQAASSGEINVPVSKGLFSPEDVYASLDEVVAGKKPGRRSPEEVTIFDSTGIAIEDIALARLIYAKARRENRYLALDFIEG